MHAGHPVVVSTQPVPDDSAVAQPMTASSLASSAPQNGPGTRRHATSRARHHSAYINACRAACMYATVWRDLTRPPQVAPPSRSRMAPFPRSVSSWRFRCDASVDTAWSPARNPPANAFEFHRCGRPLRFPAVRPEPAVSASSSSGATVGTGRPDGMPEFRDSLATSKAAWPA